MNKYKWARLYDSDECIQCYSSKVLQLPLGANEGVSDAMDTGFPL